MGVIKGKPSTARRIAQRGVEMIEFTLVLLPMLGFIFLLMDLGWAIYKRATLQFAVREGCRYAVTNQTQNLTDANGNAYGVIDSIKYVVQRRANGLLGSAATDTGYSLIQVRYYNPNNSLTAALTVPTSCATNTGQPPNWGGNLVEVSVENFQATPLAPLFRSSSPLNFTARSSDRMEGNPPTGVPLTFNGTCP
jgi:Flp pilus assembly protein TadG